MVPSRVEDALDGQMPHSALVTSPTASVGSGGFSSEAKPASYNAVSVHVGQSGKT